MSRYGLIGQKLDYSFSKWIHESIFHEINRQDTYDLIEIQPEQFSKEIENVLMRYEGLNVTMPYKALIMPFLDEVDERAKAIGAVNTVVRENGKLVGYNTDYDGIDYTIRQLPKYKTAIVLGTGGASKAVIKYLRDQEISLIYQVSRNIKSGEVIEKTSDESYNKVQLISYETLGRLNFEKALLVNCTPVGMLHIPTPLSVSDDLIEKLAGVFDLVYNPLETLLLQKSKQFEIPCRNGIDMLIYQAMMAEKHWGNLQKYNYNKLLVAIKEQIMIKIK